MREDSEELLKSLKSLKGLKSLKSLKGLKSLKSLKGFGYKSPSHLVLIAENLNHRCGSATKG